MHEIYTCGAKDFLQKSKIPIRVLKDENTIYEEMAELTANEIKAKNGKPCLVICPVGPVGQYPKLAEQINREKISLKNCTFINMDEYLNEDDSEIAYDNPLSFHAAMDKYFYSKIESQLLPDPKNRIFPNPKNPVEADRLFERLGNADICLTSVGINGHIAFNEPPGITDSITDAEFANIGTRCLDITKETIVNNGSRKIFGALDIFPKRCISLGMKQILGAKILKIYLYCDWHWGIMRKIALEPKTRFNPASFLQEHRNAEMVITEELLNRTLF